MPHSRVTNRRFRWLAIAVLLFLPLTAKALPVSDYQKNLQRAITALDTLAQVDENENAAEYESRVDHTVAAVTEALPEHETVQASNQTCKVDNSWLHAALKDFKQSTAEQRSLKLTQIIDRLKSIEERVGYEQRPATPAEAKTQRREKLESILARPEYTSEAKGPNALARLFQDFIRWLQRLFPKPIRTQPGRSNWVTVVVQVLIVIAALVVLILVAKMLLERLQGTRGKREPKKRKARIVLGERLEPEDTASDLLSEAEALARRGDLRAAIRKAYIALLVELGDRKLISLAQNKTNRDYLNAVRNIPLLHSRMRSLTDSFERHWYGFIDANETDWQDFRAGYRAALQTGN